MFDPCILIHRGIQDFGASDSGGWARALFDPCILIHRGIQDLEASARGEGEVRVLFAQWLHLLFNLFAPFRSIIRMLTQVV